MVSNSLCTKWKFFSAGKCWDNICFQFPLSLLSIKDILVTKNPVSICFHNTTVQSNLEKPKTQLFKHIVFMQQ
jgi:hypothetical protein